MNINETKLELVKIILDTKEEALLEQVKEILSPEGDWWDKLSAQEKAAIDEGLAQANRGELIPHEQVMEEISKRFKK
jgi:thiamine pyrophosphate-dependent acetolactate synthase large subunit-like protein